MLSVLWLLACIGTDSAPAPTVVRDIPYVQEAGASRTLDLYLPAPTGAKRPPLVVYIHGGGFMGGDKGMVDATPWSRQGFAVASVNYRLSGEALFPAAVMDVRAAVRWLRKHADDYGYDPDRIGAFGESAGGNLAAMVGVCADVQEFDTDSLKDVSSRVQAVVDFFGPTDFLKMDEQRLPNGMVHNDPQSPESRYLGGPLQERKEAAARANPITFVTPDDPPFFIAHGDQDPLVPFGQSELLRDALVSAGVPVEFMKAEGQGHGFRVPEPLLAAIAFMKKHLAD